MISFYYPGNSLLHKTPAGLKLLGLVLLGSLVFQISEIATLLGIGSLLALLFVIGRIPLHVAFRQLRPALFLLIVIFIAQYFIEGIEVATFVVLRFAILILAAGLVTVTSRVSDMVAAIELALKPFSRWIAVAKVSLAITLAIRFIPVLGSIIQDVKDAQKARGLDRNVMAVLIPVIVRTLKMATEVAEALDARSFAATPSDLSKPRD